MAVTAKNIVPIKAAEATQTKQYTANNVTTIIDKFTATNYSGTAATITVHLVGQGDNAADVNIITQTKSLQPAEVFTFPELVGQILNAGTFISTIASAADSINIRVSGREIS